MSSVDSQITNETAVQETLPSATYAIAARYNPATGMITVDLNRGFSISFHKSRSQALHRATDEQLSEIEVYNPGWSVFFPKLDDGFTVEGILAGRFGNRHWEEAWAAAHREPQAA